MLITLKAFERYDSSRVRILDIFRVSILSDYSLGFSSVEYGTVSFTPFSILIFSTHNSCYFPSEQAQLCGNWVPGMRHLDFPGRNITTYLHYKGSSADLVFWCVMTIYPAKKIASQTVVGQAFVLCKLFSVLSILAIYIPSRFVSQCWRSKGEPPAPI